MPREYESALGIRFKAVNQASNENEREFLVSERANINHHPDAIRAAKLLQIACCGNCTMISDCGGGMGIVTTVKDSLVLVEFTTHKNPSIPAAACAVLNTDLRLSNVATDVIYAEQLRRDEIEADARHTQVETKKNTPNAEESHLEALRKLDRLLVRQSDNTISAFFELYLSKNDFNPLVMSKFIDSFDKFIEGFETGESNPETQYYQAEFEEYLKALLSEFTETDLTNLEDENLNTLLVEKVKELRQKRIEKHGDALPTYETISIPEIMRLSTLLNNREISNEFTKAAEQQYLKALKPVKFGLPHAVMMYSYKHHLINELLFGKSYPEPKVKFPKKYYKAFARQARDYLDGKWKSSLPSYMQ